MDELKEHIAKVRMCSNLLPEPGQEVVEQQLRLVEELAKEVRYLGSALNREMYNRTPPPNCGHAEIQYAMERAGVK